MHAAARRMGYSVNSAARSLRSGRYNAIALYLPHRVIGLDYYMHFVGEAVDVAHTHRLAVTLLASQPKRNALQAQVDGAIIIDPILGDRTVEQLLAANYPVVSADTYLGSGPQPSVTIASDHEAALRGLLNHLEEHGARAPSFIAPMEDSLWARALRSAYLTYCAERGIPSRIREIPTNMANAADTRDVAKSLLVQSPPPDCLIGGPDGAAVAALGAAQELGLRVGGDFLLASCVDSAILSLCNPPITALDLDPRGLARSCVNALVSVLQGEQPDALVDHPTVLRERPSTRGVAGQA